MLWYSLVRAGVADPGRLTAWQAAAVLGHGIIVDRPEPSKPGQPARRHRGRDLIAERMRHAAGEGPKPEPTPHMLTPIGDMPGRLG